MYSPSEENYIKTIYHLAPDNLSVSTTAIAAHLQTKASSVTDMLQKLADKKLVKYTKYKGAKLTTGGQRQALQTVRKHRLWEVFLVEKLGFGWEEVHELAEQLEHIQSPKLADKLADFLNHPQFDPHGDPIPAADGVLPECTEIPLAQCKPNQKVVLHRVADGNPDFLQYLSQLPLAIGDTLTIAATHAFDGSVEIALPSGQRHNLSNMVCNRLFVNTL